MPPPAATPRDAAVHIVRVLRDAGHVAYFAGGCVRDALLGLTPKDYDVATDARPERVRELLPRSRFVGEAFGVVLTQVGRHAVEVATFRSEWGYTDKRRPDHVIFTDAEHDAQRRDFTINGLFADPLEQDPVTGSDRVIDYVGGVRDIEARLVRAIGDASDRFSEDYLRMLRAPRFAARLNFQVETRTAAAIRPLAKYLGQISRERIGQEVHAMLMGPRPAPAAKLVQELRLDGPTLNEPAADHPLETLTNLSDRAAYATRLAAWMIDRHTGDRSLDALAMFAEREAGAIERRWRNALCLSNSDRALLRHVIALVAMTRRWPQMRIALRKRLLAERHWPQARLLLEALPLQEELAALDRDAAPLLAEGVAPKPLVTGEDLIKLGLSPGPDFRRLLDGVYDAQLENEVTTAEEARAWVMQHV